MYNILIKRFSKATLVVFGLLLTMSVKSQKYKTFSDTTRLNKKYGEISLEISKLNSRLIEEKNKTNNYHSKSTSSTDNATASAEKSKEQATVATNGNTKETKRAVKDAKIADKKANNAKQAIADEKANSETIRQLTVEIDKKQKLLKDLDAQRAAIFAGAVPLG
jgi:type II secretory pathway component GspD/PulD (secretin)